MGTTLGSRSHMNVSQYTFVLTNHNNNYLNEFIMRTKKMNFETRSLQEVQLRGKVKIREMLLVIAASILMVFGSLPAQAHCDSYDGPVIQEAIKALEVNDANLVLKWVDKDQEQEIIALFNKTYKLRSGDKEVYAIVEKYFLETLVRLHRETEGAPYTGLKPAGTTEQIVQLSDHALESKDIDGFLKQLNKHIEKVIREKYLKVISSEKVKNESIEKGREYVKAYVDYTHTLEVIHSPLENGAKHAGHNH